MAFASLTRCRRHFYRCLQICCVALIGVVFVEVATEGSPSWIVILQFFTGKSSMSSFVSSSHKSERTLPLCARDDIRQGRWVRVERQEPMYIPTAWYQRRKNDSLLCPQVETYLSSRANDNNTIDQQIQGDVVTEPQQHRRQVPWVTYDWVPQNADSCQMVDWNATQFCEIMHNKTLAVVGDSINLELRNSLFFILGGNAERNLPPESLKLVCGNRMKLYFLRDDNLENFQYVLNKTGGVIDVLIINRGAHYQTDDLLLPSLRNYTREVIDYQSQMRLSHNKSVRVFWRTTPPGHLNCLNVTEPAQSLQLMESIIGNKSLHKMPHWGWWDFKRQNEVILAELAASNLTYDILDGYEMMIMRPDLHKTREKDCLHSCYPGKSDAYTPLLLHYLMQDPYKVSPLS